MFSRTWNTHHQFLVSKLLSHVSSSFNNVKKEMTAEAVIPSTSVSDKLLRRKLNNNDFIVLRESIFDQQFDEFARKSLLFKSADDLNFCKLNILSDVVSKLLYSCCFSSNMNDSMFVRFLSLNFHDVNLKRTQCWMLLNKSLNSFFIHKNQNAKLLSFSYEVRNQRLKFTETLISVNRWSISRMIHYWRSLSISFR